MISHKANSRLFTSNIISSIANREIPAIVYSCVEYLLSHKYIKPTASLIDVFESAYQCLFKKFRCEYVYKNSLVNKIMLGRHSVKTTGVISELRIGNSKLDFLVMNGTTVGYEIKTKFDSLNRLQSQIADYQKAVDLLYIYTCEDFIDKLLEITPHSVGICQLSDSYHIKIIKKPQKNQNNVCPSTLFSSLRKPEYCKAIKNQYGKLPAVPNTKIFEECKKLFSRLPSGVAHEAFLSALKQRQMPYLTGCALKDFPQSLRLAIINSKPNKSERENIKDMLAHHINDI